MAPNLFYLAFLLFHWLVLPMEAITPKSENGEAEKVSILNEQALEHLYEEPEKAKSLANEALRLSQSTDLKGDIAYSYNILGLIYDNQGNYKEAINYYIQSLKIREEIEDKQAIGVSLNNIGQFYYAQGNDILALNYLQKALQYAQNTEDELSTGYIYNNLGLIYDNDSNYEEASKYYKKAIVVFEKMEDYEGKATTLHNISWLYYAENKIDSALYYVNEALAIDIQNKYQEGVAANYNLIGTLYKQQGNYQEAIASFNQGLEESKKIGAFPMMAKAHEGMAKAYAENKDFDKALIHLEAYKMLNDSIFNESSFQDISTTQALYDAQLREKEIMLLQSQKKLDGISMSFHRTFIYLLVTSVLILLFVLFLLLKQNKQNNKTNRALNEHTQKIEEQNKTLAFYNQELRNSQIKLKEFNETKDKFFSIISHDLKSPLNSLKGLLQLLEMQSDTLSEKELIHLAKSIQHSIENLAALLDNLLQWSMSQMGQIKQEPSKVDLDALIKENISLLEINAQAKSIQIKVDTDEKKFVLADDNMTSFIIRNLLSNAIKFTPEGGCISLQEKATNDHAYLTVEDNGIGISPEDIDKLFKIGENFTTRGTAQEKGTGLGLILCKEFIEKNNGKITVESTFGKGTKFTIALPLYQKNTISI